MSQNYITSFSEKSKDFLKNNKMFKFRFIEHFPIGSVGALIERPRAIGDRPYELSCSTNRNLYRSQKKLETWQQV